MRSSIENSPIKRAFEFSDETGLLLDSSGGLKYAEKYFDSENILIMNGDEIYLPQQEGYLAEALHLHKKNNNLMTLLVMDHPQVGLQFGGIWADAQNNIVTIAKKKPDQTEFSTVSKGWHYIGAAIVSKEIFKLIPSNRPQNIFYDTALMALSTKQPLQVFPVKGWWHEAGNLHDYLAAHMSCLNFLRSNNSYEMEFFSKIQQNLNHQGRIEKTKNGLLFSETNISTHHKEKIEGFCVLGKNITFLSEPLMKNSVVSDNMDIKNDLVDTLIV